MTSTVPCTRINGVLSRSQTLTWATAWHGELPGMVTYLGKYIAYCLGHGDGQSNICPPGRPRSRFPPLGFVHSIRVRSDTRPARRLRSSS
ncbi:hypothetical protein BDV06DRAFT_54002 [Aspergillus oleicola]